MTLFLSAAWDAASVGSTNIVAGADRRVNDAEGILPPGGKRSRQRALPNTYADWAMEDLAGYVELIDGFKVAGLVWHSLAVRLASAILSGGAIGTARRQR
jgi:hypothetical protein